MMLSSVMMSSVAIPFNGLGKEQIKQIVDIQLEYLRKRLAERKIEIELTDAAKEHLAEEGFDPSFGARPLKRTIQRRVQDPLAMKILDGEVHDGDRVLVDAADGNITFTATHPVPEAEPVAESEATPVG